MSHLEEAAEFKRIYMRNSWNNASRYMKLYEGGERRLSRFPLWRRLLFYWKFNKIKRLIQMYKNTMEAQFAIAMKLSNMYCEDVGKLKRKIDNEFS